MSIIVFKPSTLSPQLSTNNTGSITMYKNNQTTNLQPNKAEPLRQIILFALCILIFYPPYARGLFFTKELLPFHIMSFSLFILLLIYKFINKDYAIFKTPIDYALFGLVIAYLLPIMFGQAANVRAAIEELLKYCNYFVVYIMIRDIVKGKKDIITILNVILASAIGMCLIGIDGAAGEKLARIIENIVNILPGVDYKIFGVYVGGRINSMMQYPNAFASYILAAFIISTGLLIVTKNKIVKHIYSGLSFIFLLTIIFTYSRGVWLLVPVVFVLLIILLRDVYIIMEVVLHTITTGIVTLCAIPLFNKFIAEEKTIAIWLVLLVGTILAIILSFIMGLLIDFLRKFSKKRLMIAGISFIIVVVLFIGTFIGIALNIEQPVELSNMGSEKNTTKTISKVIDDLEINTEYILNYDVEYTSTNDKQWAYRIRIDSINAEKENENIITINNIELEEENTVIFNTLEDTEKIKISIQNYYIDSSVNIENVTLVNQANGKADKIIFKYKYIPDSIVRRFESIDLEDSSTDARFAFYNDAFKIIKDKPIIGTGGGGWSAMYFMYQSYMYWSTQVHNYFMQVWIETGTLGFLILIALIGLILWNIHKSTWRNKEKHKDSDNNKVWIAFLSTAVLSLFLHSAIDFDFTLGAMALMVWELLALFVVTINYLLEQDAISKKHYKYEYICTAIVIIITLVFITNLQVGYSSGQKAITMLNENNHEAALEYYENAVKHDSFNASYRMDLAKLYQSLSVQQQNGMTTISNQEQFDNTEVMMQKALELEPYNSKLYAYAASIMMNRGKLDEGLEFLDKSIKVQPLRTENYQQKADLYFRLGINYLNSGKYEEGEKKLQEVLNIPVVITELNKIILKPISLNEQSMEYIERADYLLNNYRDTEAIKKFNKMVYNSYINADTYEDGLLDTWVNYNAKGSDVKIEISDNGTLKVQNTGNNWGRIRTRFLALKPNQKYVLELNLASHNIDNKDVIIYVLSSKGKSIQLKKTNINMANQEQVYKFEFITTDDISEGNQYIRFDLNGNENEHYVEIKDVMIYEAE